ncbi:MAG: metallophosphoesterase [Moraxella sp.]|nr:metallophosphoesterase [Moraxella sp.]
MPTPFRLAQLSDLHLTGVVGEDKSYTDFLAVLQLAKSQRPHALLLTGDLVNDGLNAGYDWLFTTLKNIDLPFFTLAGNHDVTHEHNSHLPFHLRHFSPLKKDDRLAECQRHLIGNWQLLLLNSAIAGKTHGTLTEASFDWLNNTLSAHTEPAVIALHHPPKKVGSAWIDAYRLENGDRLYALLSTHPHAKVILTGHVHQAHTLTGSPTLYTCPATSRQFLPFFDEFALDNVPAGFRCLYFYDNGTHHSEIFRLNSPK